MSIIIRHKKVPRIINCRSDNKISIPIVRRGEASAPLPTSTLQGTMLRSSEKWLPVLLVLALFRDCQGQKPVMSPAKPVIYIHEGDSLELACTSAKTMAFYYPKDVINEIATSAASLREQSMSDKKKIMFRRSETVHGDTGWYGCADHDFHVTPGIYDQPEVSWTYVYVTSNTSYFVQFNVLQAFRGIIGGTATLPCRPTSPNYKVILTADDEEIQMCGNVSYDPRFGFQLRNVTFKDRGFFRCLIQETNTIQEINFHLHSIWSHVLNDVKLVSPSVNRIARGRTSYVSCSTDVEADVPYVFNWTTPQKRDRITTRIYKETIGLNRQKIISVLTINGVTDEDEGEYECSMTTFSAVRKHKMYIMVYDPNINDIKLMPLYGNRNLTGQFGNHMELVVLVNAHPQTELRWNRSKSSAKHGEIIVSKPPKYVVERKSYSTILKIHSLTFKDSGVYSLEATNEDGIKILDFALEVITKPKVNLYRFSTCYLLNEIANIGCNVVARPAPNITWTFSKASPSSKDYPSIDESEMTKLTNYSIVPDSHQEYNSVVTMMVGTPGKLTCMACNTLGCESDTGEVDISDVHTGFGIMKKDENEAELVEGDDFEIICTAARKYYFGVNWLNNEQIAVAETDRISITNSSEDYSHRSTLRIENVQKSDNGSNYLCEAQGKFDVGRRWYTLVIHDPIAPFISETNMNKTTVAFDLSTEGHKTVILKCHVQGVPKPNVTWYKDVTIISANEQYEFRYKNQELYIKYLLDENSGRYTCKVENRFGKDEKYQIILVKVQEAPKVLIIPIVVLTVTCAIILIYFAVKKHRKKVKRKELMEIGLTHFEEGALQCLNPNLTVDEQAELLPYDKKWEFPRERLKFEQQLGYGAFGVVMKANALGICKDETVSTVAVKMARKSTASTYIGALASELKIMVHLGKHLNIVNLLGACTKNIMERELLVIVEYCRYGNLHDYLLRHRADFINQIDPTTVKLDLSIELDSLTKTASVEHNNSLSADSSSINVGVDLVSNTTSTNSQCTIMSPDVSILSDNSTQADRRMNYRGDYKDQNLKPICTQNLLSWAFQVARGMEYLSQRKVLHGDLAARNILLVDEDIVKICDFGLARTMYNDDSYQKQGGVPLPIKWMAIESIRDRIFSTQSDIWSFGIVLWEFFTLAKTPYPSMGPERQYQRLIEGYRMEQPEYATDEIYDIMLQCWRTNPTSRPTFTYLVSSIGDLLEENLKEHYVELNAPYLDMNNMVLGSDKDDYLMMMSAPDHHALVSPTTDYLNSPKLSRAIPQDDSYVPMGPSIRGGDLGILSQRLTSNCNRTNFPTTNGKSNGPSDSAESTGVEQLPMLNHEDDDYL